MKIIKYHLKRELWFCLQDAGCDITKSLLECNWKKKAEKKKNVFFPIQVMPVQKQKCGAPRYRSPGPILYWQYGCPSCSSFVIFYNYPHHLVLAMWFSIMISTVIIIVISSTSTVGNTVAFCHIPPPILYWPSRSSFVILSFSHHLVLAIRFSIMFINRHCHYHWHRHCHHPVLEILVQHNNYQSFSNIRCCHCHDFRLGG